MATNDKNCANLKCLYSYSFLYTPVKYNYLDSNRFTFVLLNHIKRRSNCFLCYQNKKKGNFQGKTRQQTEKTLLSVKTVIIISTYNTQQRRQFFLSLKLLNTVKVDKC